MSMWTSKIGRESHASLFICLAGCFHYLFVNCNSSSMASRNWDMRNLCVDLACTCDRMRATIENKPAMAHNHMQSESLSLNSWPEIAHSLRTIQERGETKYVTPPIFFFKWDMRNLCVYLACTCDRMRATIENKPTMAHNHMQWESLSLNSWLEIAHSLRTIQESGKTKCVTPPIFF